MEADKRQCVGQAEEAGRAKAPERGDRFELGLGAAEQRRGWPESGPSALGGSAGRAIAGRVAVLCLSW